MADISNVVESADDLVDAVVIGPEAYISRDYLQREKDRLWRKV